MAKGQVEIFVSDNVLLKFRSGVSYPPISMQILETIQIKLFWFCDKSLKMSTNDLILECVNIWLLTIKFKQRNPTQVKIIFLVFRSKIFQPFFKKKILTNRCWRFVVKKIVTSIIHHLNHMTSRVDSMSWSNLHQ